MRGASAGAQVTVRDVRLLEAAIARPRATAFGADAHRTLHDKAAALLHSVVRNHALVDGNKRLGLASVIALYGLNGRGLTMTDEAYLFIMSIAAGELDDVGVIATRLKSKSVAA